MYRRAEPVFYACDLVWLDGKDLGTTSLARTQRTSTGLLLGSDCPKFIDAQFIEEAGNRTIWPDLGTRFKGACANVKTVCTQRTNAPG